MLTRWGVRHAMLGEPGRHTRVVVWQVLPEVQLRSRALPGQTLPGPAAQVQALQFEWAWQHPDKSKALREAYGSIRKADLKGARGKVRPWLRQLNLPWWAHIPGSEHVLVPQAASVRARRLGCVLGVCVAACVTWPSPSGLVNPRYSPGYASLALHDHETEERRMARYGWCWRCCAWSPGCASR